MQFDMDLNPTALLLHKPSIRHYSPFTFNWHISTALVQRQTDKDGVSLPVYWGITGNPRRGGGGSVNYRASLNRPYPSRVQGHGAAAGPRPGPGSGQGAVSPDRGGQQVPRNDESMERKRHAFGLVYIKSVYKFKFRSGQSVGFPLAHKPIPNSLLWRGPFMSHCPPFTSSRTIAARTAVLRIKVCSEHALASSLSIID
jgi:hypothetical protein